MKKIIVCVMFLFIGIFAFAEQQEPSIITATKTGNIEMIQLFLDKNVDINECDKFRDTALMIAVRKKDIPLIKYLIDHGANVNPKPNAYEDTPLSYAIRYEQIDIVNYLIEHGAKIVQKEKNNGK